MYAGLKRPPDLANGEAIKRTWKRCFVELYTDGNTTQMESDSRVYLNRGTKFKICFLHTLLLLPPGEVPVDFFVVFIRHLRPNLAQLFGSGF